MAIGRTAMTDDDGTGTTGTIFNNAWKTALYDEIDASSGTWTDVTFAAGNFTASAGNWTLTSPDQVQFRYRIDNGTMYINYRLDATTVSATPNELRITLPASKTVSKQAWMTCHYQDNAGTWMVGNAFAQASTTYVSLQPGALGAGTWSVSTNNTSVRGLFIVEVT